MYRSMLICDTTAHRCRKRITSKALLAVLNYVGSIRTFRLPADKRVFKSVSWRQFQRRVDLRVDAVQPGLQSLQVFDDDLVRMNGQGLIQMEPAPVEIVAGSGNASL